MKIGTHVETKELPGDVVMGVGGAAPIHHIHDRDRGNSAQQPDIPYAIPGDHIFRELTKLERDFGVIADDPDSFKLTMRVTACLWIATGAILGCMAALFLVQWGIIPLVIVR